MENIIINIHYYAVLREECGLQQEACRTTVQTVQELYSDLRKRHNFRLTPELLRVAVNDEFVDWSTQLKDGDTVVFIPPVAGG